MKAQLSLIILSVSLLTPSMVKGQDCDDALTNLNSQKKRPIIVARPIISPPGYSYGYTDKLTQSESLEGTTIQRPSIRPPDGYYSEQTDNAPIVSQRPSIRPPGDYDRQDANNGSLNDSELHPGVKVSQPPPVDNSYRPVNYPRVEQRPSIRPPSDYDRQDANNSSLNDTELYPGVKVSQPPPVENSYRPVNYPRVEQRPSIRPPQHVHTRQNEIQVHHPHATRIPNAFKWSDEQARRHFRYQQTFAENEVTALNDFVNERTFSPINRMLNGRHIYEHEKYLIEGRVVKGTRSIEQTVKSLVPTLDSAIKKGPTLPQGLTLWRGQATTRDIDREISTIYEEKGFLSTSIHQKTALSFSLVHGSQMYSNGGTDQPVTFLVQEIIISEPTHGVYIPPVLEGTPDNPPHSNSQQEGEVILERGVKLEVISRETVPHKIGQMVIEKVVTRGTGNR